ncbi:Serine aminopeptidase, S33 [uncultured archaeon]|nr:Serine aminopeptidase, S33 [uncultured archaeon]
MKTSTLILILISSGILFYLALSGFNQLNSAAQAAKSDFNNSSSTTQIVTIQASGNYIQTIDGANLSFDFNKTSNHGVILLPQIGKDKSSFIALEKELNKNNITTLSIDLRGMGETIYPKQMFQFTDQDFISMQNDVDAAANYLKSNNVQLIGFVGASIGANLAFNFASKHNIGKAVLLSPGLSYRGVSIVDDLNQSNGPILLIFASNEDTYAFDSSQKIQDNYTGSLTFVKLQNEGHGANMLDSTSISKIVEFFKK